MRIPALLFIINVIIFSSSCGSTQSVNTNIEKRPLEEEKALNVVHNVLQERGYDFVSDVKIKLSNDVSFSCDVRVLKEKVSIEYLSQKDMDSIGLIPPPAQGSKLHVVPAVTVVGDEEDAPAEHLYVFFLSETDYQYHFNPTSTVRADVTYSEVESRLRRDLNDFLSWHESKEN